MLIALRVLAILGLFFIGFCFRGVLELRIICVLCLCSAKGMI